MAAKTDFKKTLDGYRASRDRFAVVDLPPMQYLMIDGHGDPNTSPAYAAALQALYPVAYALKFASQQDLGRDYVVPPLEGLWWAEDMTAFTTARDKSRWDWTMMIMTPPWIERADLDAAVDRVAAKRSPERLDEIRLESLSEGRCVQILHTSGAQTVTLGTVVRRYRTRRFLLRRSCRRSGPRPLILLADPVDSESRVCKATMPRVRQHGWGEGGVPGVT